MHLARRLLANGDQPKEPPGMLIRRFLTAAAISLGMTLASGALADIYPSRVVKIVVPFPPGGSVDITARMLAQKLTDNIGGQFIVETRSGAGGNTGADSVAKSEPDGYTLLFSAPGPLAVNKTLFANPLPFDPEKDFAPIAIFAKTPIVLMTNPKLPVANVKELLDHAKANPGKLNFGSAGMGSTPHLSGELLKTMAKVELTHVPYRGTAPAMSDLVAGHIQMMFDLLPSSLQQIGSGNVKALANAGATRAAALKDLPTVAEQGLPGFDASSWVALVAPAKTPAPVLAKLRADVGKAIADNARKLGELGSEPGMTNEGEVRAFLASETRKWAEVVKASGAKVD
jgi:tripartite-type tricarboxylate transporter receptor subunit TctC